MSKDEFGEIRFGDVERFGSAQRDFAFASERVEHGLLASQDLNAPLPEYAIAAEMLMPDPYVRALDLSSLECIRASADQLKVTPSALVVRAQNLNLLGWSIASEYLHALGAEFRRRPKPRLSSPKAVNAVLKYNGHQLTRTMLSAVDRNALTPGEFCRVVGARRIGPEDIEELRRAAG